jgi:hypothetical protein
MAKISIGMGMMGMALVLIQQFDRVWWTID